MEFPEELWEIIIQHTNYRRPWMYYYHPLYIIIEECRFRNCLINPILNIPGECKIMCCRICGDPCKWQLHNPTNPQIVIKKYIRYLPKNMNVYECYRC